MLQFDREMITSLSANINENERNLIAIKLKERQFKESWRQANWRTAKGKLMKESESDTRKQKWCDQMKGFGGTDRLAASDTLSDTNAFTHLGGLSALFRATQIIEKVRDELKK